jgi:hypothetical protein
MAGDVGSGQVHRGVTAFEQGEVSDRRGPVRAPFNFHDIRIGMRARRTPHQQNNLHAIPDDVLGQRSPDETGSTAKEKLPRHVRSAQRLGCGDGKLPMALNAASISTLSCRNALFSPARCIFIAVEGRSTVFPNPAASLVFQRSSFCEPKLHQLLSEAAYLS